MVPKTPYIFSSSGRNQRCFFIHVFFARLNEQIARVSKIEILFGNTVGAFDLSHRLFNIVYADQDQQRQLARMVKKRLNVFNPWILPDVEFEFDIERCPTQHPNGWTVWSYEEFLQRRNDLEVPIPRPDLRDTFPLIDFGKT